MKVILSPLAKFKLNLLLQYLQKEWEQVSKKRFLSKLKSSTDVMSVFPESNPKSAKFRGIYKLVITKQTSLYYRILEEKIEIITVVDNRQNPEKIEKEIEKYFESD